MKGQSHGGGTEYPNAQEQTEPAAAVHRQGLRGPREAAVQKPGAMSPSLRAKAGQLCPPRIHGLNQHSCEIPPEISSKPI